MLSPAPFRNAFPELESSIKCLFFRFLWHLRLDCLGSRHCLPRSWQTSKLSRLLPNEFHHSQSIQALTESADESESGLPAKHVSRTFYIIEPSISWLANIEIVELLTWWAIARPRMSKSLLFTVFSYLWLGSGTSRGHCDVQIIQTERPQNTAYFACKENLMPTYLGLNRGYNFWDFFKIQRCHAECHAQSQSPLCSLPRWCQQPSKYHPNTPWKINMEPTNQPFRKENDLPNLHDYVPC